MMDFLDLLDPRDDYYFTGYYYPKRPQNADDGKEIFRYRQVNPYSRRFAKILDNIRSDEEICTLKTEDECDFRIKGYISTQDGKFWQIKNIDHSEQTRGTEETVRILKTSPHVEINMLLIRVYNPWEIDE